MAPVSRNAPCPCGSNKRYKDCHGAIAAPPHPEAQPPTDATRSSLEGTESSYRPSGPDWGHLSETERTACSILMQRALKQQLAGKLVEASASYSEVLAQAPNTHDALHMLGAIELRRGNLTEARQLILAAIKLRAPYPDIEHNLRMVEDLLRVSRVDAGRAPVATEELCERALSILADLGLRPTRPGRQQRTSRNDRMEPGRSPVHLIAGVLNSSDEGAWLMWRLATLLAPLHPTVWLPAADPPEVRAGVRIRSLAPDVGDFPRDGCLVFVGLDVDCAEWIDLADAQRIVIFCQPVAPSQYLDQLRAISRDGSRPVHLLFPSQSMAARFGAGYSALPPPIEADGRQSESVHERVASVRPTSAIGVIGRLWQGTSPSEDAEFLRHVAGSAGLLEIYDPGALRYALGAEPAVRFWRRGANALRSFVSEVDCVLHVANKWWLEGDGRELFMAMAAGTPVICPRGSMFAEYIDHGVDGLLYDGRDEVIELLSALRRRPAWGMSLGRAARAKVAALVAPARTARALEEFVLGERHPIEPSVASEVRQLAMAK